MTLALRTSVLVRGADESAYVAARTTAADAVLIDLAAPETHDQRTALRRLAAKHAPGIAASGRGVVLRVSDARSGLLEDDLAGTVSEALTAVVLSGAMVAQDARDADVAIRKQEMRRKLTPGSVRLIPEVDSAAGLRALPAILDAVDRHSAVAVNVPALLRDLRAGAPRQAVTLTEHVLAEVAIAARAASIGWLAIDLDGDSAARADLATRAAAFGAWGVAVRSEPEAPGFNRLFTPPPEELERARAALAEWERVRAAGGMVGVAGRALVDRRTVRSARLVIALHEAIARRGRAK